VVIIGGGDTGMDCASNALREGAASVELLDIYPELPPDGRSPRFPWPLAPKRTATTYALEEGGKRYWNSEVIEILGTEGGCVRGVVARRVVGSSSQDLSVVPASEHELPAELVLIAIGFAHPQHEGLVAELGLALDARGNLRAPVYESSRAGAFACGDARVGQSLVVNAIAEGRRRASRRPRARLTRLRVSMVCTAPVKDSSQAGSPRRAENKKRQGDAVVSRREI
jgi:glutamate synthase (NADPH/NADH) small chain